MSDERSPNEPPAKRQKLDAEEQDLPLETWHDGYVAVACRTHKVQVNDTDTYKLLLKTSAPLEIDIVGHVHDSAGVQFRAKTPLLKGQLVFAVDRLKSSDLEFISDCVELPSTTAKSRNPGDYPLAKYLATVTIEDSQPRLSIALLWHDSHSAREKVDARLRKLLAKNVNFDTAARSSDEATPWEVREFYDNVHVPPITTTDLLRVDNVQCTLYPFQDRATRWMLSREGVEVLQSGQLGSLPRHGPGLPLDFAVFQDAHGSAAYYSSALGVVCSSKTGVLARYGAIKGGILAEAMGLGKTVEMIALMCKHTASKSPVETQPSTGQRVTGATLIITPPTILEQWKQEIREHAPGLRVYHYTGIRAASKRNEDIVEILTEQDVVLTTYNVIASEIYYAQEKPDRSLRNRPRREPPKSPLIQILWWRCLLDEAQMVESGVSNAAIVARLIPRVHAWAVTGTPLKQSHRDLYGLLLFLRYEPWCQSTRIWDYLVFYHRPLLRALISSIALRHSKEEVREELRIPPQWRRAVTIPFTAVEESHYAQMHLDMQHECGLDNNGAPLTDDWDPEDPDIIEKMRSWLQRLRQTCLHPEVGGRNRRALGKRGGGPLRTVAQVLDVMIEQTESIVHAERRNMLMAQADQARIYEHARQSQVAQDMFHKALAEADQFVADCRSELDMETKRMTNTNDEHDKQLEEPDTDADEEVDSSLTTARQRLRSALEVQHICTFFLGNTYYQLKEHEEVKLSPPATDSKKTAGSEDTEQSSGDIEKVASATVSQSAEAGVIQDVDEQEIRTRVAVLEKQEAHAYERAKKIRTELLAEVHRKATKRIAMIRAKRDASSFANISEMEYAEDDYGGIESRKVFEKLYHYCKAMNAQAEQFKEIRSKMTAMLCQVLIDEDEGVELTGEEYEDSTKHQDELYVLMEMLRALYADRHDAITGQENMLLKQETKQFLKSAREGEGPAPELMIRLMGERQKLRIDPSQQGSLRGILNEIRSLVSALEYQEYSSGRARAELTLVNQLLQHAQRLQSLQTKSINALEQEVNLYRDTMNARLDYYRALQVISDMVAPIGKNEDVGKPVNHVEVGRFQRIAQTAADRLSVASAKKRYLLHLKNEQDAEGNAKICTICQFEFEIGTLTVCGHQFCKECIVLWTKEHRNCPVCKRRLHATDFYDVTYKPQVPAKEGEAEAEQASSAEKDHVANNAIYSTVSTSLLGQIRGMDLRGPSYGSKVDTIVRHILHLRKSDPGSKSVIFSQYRDFLDVLSKCLRANDIIHSKFDDRDGIIDFKTNPANECFLLHAKAHAAGLNLVCASHVVLCEPLINTAIELQAIARVHRIGQVRETCVWMYIIEGTVEEAIYDISVKRRLAHMDGKSRDASRAVSRAASPGRGELAIEAANAKELQQADLGKMFASGKTGGEMVDKEDLWQCLFGNARTSSVVGRSGSQRRLADLPAASNVVGASSEIARHLRVEAAERRREL